MGYQARSIIRLSTKSSSSFGSVRSAGKISDLPNAWIKKKKKRNKGGELLGSALFYVRAGAPATEQWEGQQRGNGLEKGPGARAKYCTNRKKGVRSNGKALFGIGEIELFELGERKQQAQSSQHSRGWTLPIVPLTLRSWPKALSCSS